MSKIFDKTDLAMAVCVIIIMAYLAVLILTSIKLHIPDMTMEEVQKSFILSINNDLKEFALIAMGFITKSAFDKKLKKDEG